MPSTISSKTNQWWIILFGLRRNVVFIGFYVYCVCTCSIGVFFSFLTHLVTSNKNKRKYMRVLFAVLVVNSSGLAANQKPLSNQTGWFIFTRNIRNGCGVVSRRNSVYSVDNTENAQNMSRLVDWSLVYVHV